MAVKHVTIYECDVCKAHVDPKGLIVVKVGSHAMDVCGKCLRKVNNALGLAYPNECAAESLEQPHHTR